jgi:hypothetical protein
MQKLAPQKRKNCRFVNPGSDEASALIKFSKPISGSLILYLPFPMLVTGRYNLLWIGSSIPFQHLPE